MNQEQRVLVAIKFAKANQTRFTGWEFGDLVSESWIAIGMLQQAHRPGGVSEEAYIGALLRRRLIDSWRRQDRHRHGQLDSWGELEAKAENRIDLDGLTEKESTALGLAGRGLKYSTIAERLGYRSPQSIADIISRIRKKVKA